MSKTYVPLGRIESNPYQSRIDTGDVESLAKKILEHGLRSLPEARLIAPSGDPVTGSLSRWTETKEKTWFLDDNHATTAELATGHRRVHAVRLLNDDDTLTEADLKDAGLRPGYVPVDLQRLSDEEMLDLLTIENAARKDLSPIEQARLIREHTQTGRTQSEIGEVFGRTPSWVSKRKRLLDYPSSIQDHIHTGKLSVRQANALQPIFEAEVDPDLFPDGHRFAPGEIVERALNGRSSEDLRKEVRQFESWVKQLRGKTQEEIRQQEYEDELEEKSDSTPYQKWRESRQEEPESDTQSDGSGPDRQSDKTATETSPEHESPSPKTPPPSADDRGSSGSERDPVRGDAPGAREEHDNGQRDGTSRTTAEEIGGDGVPVSEETAREEETAIGRVVDHVARQLSEKVDRGTQTAYLILLGLGREQERRQKIEQRLRRYLADRDAGTARQAAGVLHNWLSELGIAWEVDFDELDLQEDEVPA